MNPLRIGRKVVRKLTNRGHVVPEADTTLALQRIELSLRELRAMALAQSVPAASLWESGPSVPPAPSNTPVFDHSLLCRQSHFESGYFTYWVGQIAHTPRYHRKLWEFVFILQALYERGLLREGSKGLGFGVGKEPLSALFASRGCAVTATDADAGHATKAGWSQSEQHAANLDGLRWPQICDDRQFDRQVTFQPFDMNQTPGSFRGFDFCWSACALEHLGSIDKGLAFIRNSLDCLRPGGIAVHTTEFNLHHNDQTLDHQPTVLFRRRDLEKLFAELEAEGHLCAPLDFTEGHEPVERFIDMPPYRQYPHLKLALNGIATTSIGLIVQRGVR